jgi:hypothetical protein
MKREQLTQLVKTTATAHGLNFHTGSEHLILSTLRSFPVAWLSPPVLRSHSGREECETTWQLTIHLIDLPKGAGTEEIVWQDLEKKALTLAADLLLSPDVCRVADVACTPARGSLTAQGEISVALTFNLTMWYLL